MKAKNKRKRLPSRGAIAIDQPMKNAIEQLMKNKPGVLPTKVNGFVSSSIAEYIMTTDEQLNKFDLSRGEYDKAINQLRAAAGDQYDLQSANKLLLRKYYRPAADHNADPEFLLSENKEPQSKG